MGIFQNVTNNKFDELYENKLSSDKYKYLDENKNINVHDYVLSKLQDQVYQGFIKQRAMIRAKEYTVDCFGVVCFLLCAAVALIIVLVSHEFNLPTADPSLEKAFVGYLVALALCLFVHKFLRSNKEDASIAEIRKNMKQCSAYKELEVIREYMQYIQDAATYNSVKKVSDFVHEHLDVKSDEK